MSIFFLILTLKLILDEKQNPNWTVESVMCDVIKIRLKRKDERRKGKETPKTEMVLYVFL